MASPQQRVLHTAELLEAILLNLGYWDLFFNAQHVSKQWNAAVTGSPILQQKIFIRGIPLPCPESAYPDQLRFRVGYTKNPILEDRLPRLFGIGIGHRPLEQENGGTWSSVTTSDITGGVNNISLSRWLRPSASWRQMQVAQPPIKNVYWHIRIGDDVIGRVPMLLAEFKFPDGLRMGDYYDLVAGTSNGSHAFMWPDSRAEHRILVDTFSSSPELARLQWYLDKRFAAHRNLALWVSQEVSKQQRENVFRCPASLVKYHSRLQNLELFEPEEEGDEESRSYTAPTYDSSEAAMAMFLDATQNSEENENSSLFDFAAMEAMTADPVVISFKTAFQREGSGVTPCFDKLGRYLNLHG
ncbi:hypothetical protein GGR53DRAFT_512098 [Hypoxylon sp. FL1150]|nr:hypothetical protein GGR53DRAFT_512098 [Hypoxylon sp. FL1150]